jgi:hypothetical protein
MIKDAYAGSAVLNLTIIPVMAQTPADLEEAFATMNKQGSEALVVLADGRLGV